MKTGQRINDLRLKFRFTQDELAVKLGLTKAQISNYERDISNIPADKLIMLCEIFKVTPNYLLGYDTPEKGNSSNCPACNMKDKYIENLLRSIEDRERTIKHAETLYGELKEIFLQIKANNSLNSGIPQEPEPDE